MTTGNAKPRAYRLALDQRPGLIAALETLKSNLSGDGASARLETFNTIIRGGLPAINMSVAGCVRFLETGRWLNIHEVVARELGHSREPEYSEALQEKLGEWHSPRVDLETLLRFRRDTHYAAVNIGGAGPDYGHCCIRLGGDLSLEIATTFSGDPLRVAFNDVGTRVMSDERVLERFATYDDRAELAYVHNFNVMEDQLVIDERKLIQILENRETLIEIHIHGKVTRDHVIEIGIRPDYYDSLTKRCLDYEFASLEEREATRFVGVKAFKKLLYIADYRNIHIKKLKG